MVIIQLIIYGDNPINVHIECTTLSVVVLV